MNEEEKNNFVLGLDWGKNISGLAIGNINLKIASPLKEIQTLRLIGEIDQLKKEWNFKIVVIGWEKWQEDFFQKRIKRLIYELEKMGYEVVKEEEKFSSQLAQKNLKEKRIRGISKKNNAEAARIILQSWLEKHIN